LECKPGGNFRFWQPDGTLEVRGNRKNAMAKGSASAGLPIDLGSRMRQNRGVGNVE